MHDSALQLHVSSAVLGPLVPRAAYLRVDDEEREQNRGEALEQGLLGYSSRHIASLLRLLVSLILQRDKIRYNIVMFPVNKPNLRLVDETCLELCVGLRSEGWCNRLTPTSRKQYPIARP